MQTIEFKSHMTRERTPVLEPGDALHRRLARFNRRRIAPCTPTARWEEMLREDLHLQLLEGHFIESERAAAHKQMRDLPQDPAEFLRWFESLRETGPGQGDELFEWLEREASLDQMRWFAEQEVGGEAGFDDLVALSQLSLPQRPKLEMARNYWDEMGRGRASAMHGPMLARASDALGIKPSITRTVWEALALANLMQGLASNRRYAYQSIGALGVVELTAPSRVSRVAAGMERLGLGAEVSAYFRLHSTMDVAHSRAWNQEVIAPLIECAPDVQQAIAEGALMRLNAGARCFARYRAQLFAQHRFERAA